MLALRLKKQPPLPLQATMAAALSLRLSFDPKLDWHVQIVRKLRDNRLLTNRAGPWDSKFVLPIVPCRGSLFEAASLGKGCCEIRSYTDNQCSLCCTLCPPSSLVIWLYPTSRDQNSLPIRPAVMNISFIDSDILHCNHQGFHILRIN